MCSILSYNASKEPRPSMPCRAVYVWRSHAYIHRGGLERRKRKGGAIVQASRHVMSSHAMPCLCVGSP